MSDHNQDHQNTRGLPFSHGFNFGTTLQNVFRNINHAFASNHDSSSGQQREHESRGRTDDIHSPVPLSSVDGRHATASRPSSSSAASNPPPPPLPSRPPFDSQRDEDEDSMPDLRSVTDESDESDVSLVHPVPPQQDMHPVDDDRNSVWTDDEGDSPPLEPMVGSRRARVDDDGDDARDRRHPSERVGGPPPGDAAPQNANPQQLPRPPAGLSGALFGLGPPGGDAPPEHIHTGEGIADHLPAGNNPTPGRVPRGVPSLTAGFTFTIPLFGPPPGPQTGPAAGGQGGGPGMFGMDAASREELFASFAAFFQEFQALDEGREDPERAKKLVAGLEVVPLGLVQRLERVGGAPGGHVGDSSAEGSLSGCAICWDSLLDAEGDGFGGRQFSGEEGPPSSATGNSGQDETRTENDAMVVDAPTVPDSQFEPGLSASASPSQTAKIISLPCAHVFHASCLLPWFTRARQATCPTCRFNIDPENLTYTPPPRRAFSRGPPDNAAPAHPLDEPEVPLQAPATPNAVDPADPARATPDARPAPPPPAGQAGPPPAGLGFNPFVAIPGIPVLSFPAIQIPLRQNATQPGGGNQGIDVLTIGLDMFVGGPPPGERGGDPRDNADGTDGADNGGTGAGAAGGNGAANPNGLAQDLHSLIEGLLRTTRNIIPQVIHAQGQPAPAPAADAAPAEGAQPPAQAGPAPDAAGPQAGAAPPAPPGSPRFIPVFPLRPNMFRPTRPMPPRRERKAWTLPPAPGPSLRQRIEQREREQGLRCCDTSCGVGPSDEDPYPEVSVPLTKQVCIHSLPGHDSPESDRRAFACAHAFHPACLVSAERVAGWGGESKTEPLVEVSCPVCRAVGCVTREEWESGVAAL